MTYQEQRVWVTMISGLLVFFLYMRRALGIYNMEGMAVFEDTSLWARTMLLYIGIGVVAIIVVMIVFHIVLAISAEVNKKIQETVTGEMPDDEEVYFDPEDEMDKLIGLKAGQIGYVVVGIGFIGGLITVAVGMAPGIMMNMAYLSFMLGNLLEGAVKIYFYKRGVSHG